MLDEAGAHQALQPKARRKKVIGEKDIEKIVAKIPVGRLGHAEEIARAVAFLCAEDGGFITGSTMSINGGQHMY